MPRWLHDPRDWGLTRDFKQRPRQSSTSPRHVHDLAHARSHGNTLLADILTDYYNDSTLYHGKGRPLDMYRPCPTQHDTTICDYIVSQVELTGCEPDIIGPQCNISPNAIKRWLYHGRKVDERIQQSRDAHDATNGRECCVTLIDLSHSERAYYQFYMRINAALSTHIQNAHTEYLRAVTNGTLEHTKVEKDILIRDNKGVITDTKRIVDRETTKTTRDGKMAKDYLSIHLERYKKPRNQMEITGIDGGSIEITQPTIDKDSLTPEELKLFKDALDILDEKREQQREQQKQTNQKIVEVKCE